MSIQETQLLTGSIDAYPRLGTGINANSNQYRTNIVTPIISCDFQVVFARFDDTYELGDRVGQIVFIKLPKIKLKEVQELSITERGIKGYGASGK